MANEIVPLTIADLTRGAVSGDGAFDKIMSTIDVRLTREYEKNRIKGSDYSKVYLGAMEAAMQQSIAFLLGKDKAANEAALIAAQVELTEAQVRKTEEEIKLVTQQIAKVQAEIALIENNATKVAEEINLLKAQTSKTYAEVNLLGTQNSNLGKEGNILDYRLSTLLPSENSKLTAEAALITAQKETETAKTASTTVDGNTYAGLIGAQIGKLNGEIELLDQKYETERAQTNDTNGAINYNGIVGAQRNVYLAQIDGFKRDAEKNLAKIFSDTWSVQASNSILDTTQGYGFSSAEVKSVMDTARKGIGITVVPD